MKDDSAATLNSESVLNRASRLLLSAFVLAALVPVLTLANPATDEPEFKQTLGVYGDWTAYQLEDDALQVCYVETAFIPAPGAEPDFSEVRLQVSNRAFNPGTNLIRFTLNHIFPHYRDIPQLIWVSPVPKKSFPLASLLTPEDYDSFGRHDDELVNDMKSGEVTDVALVQYQNWEDNREDKNGTRLGSYSMEGFIEAYEAISRACPLRPERPAQAEKIQVTVGDMLVVKESPRYYELNFTGPFFEAHKPDEVTIRGYSGTWSDISNEDLTDSADVLFLLAIDTERWEFYRNGALAADINVGPVRGIYGVCLDPELERLKFLVGVVLGGRIESQTSVYFVPDTGIAWDVHYSHDSYGPDLSTCLENEFQWKEDEPFLPCQCAGSASSGNELYYSTLDTLRVDIEQEERNNNDAQPRTVNDDTFSALLSRVDRLAPFVWWDAYSHFDVQRFESPKYAIVSIAFHDRTYYYNSFQQVFVRRLNEDAWTEVYYHDSAYIDSTTASIIYGFHDEETVDVKTCFQNVPDGDYACYNSLNYERQLITVEEWLQKAAPAK